MKSFRNRLASSASAATPKRAVITFVLVALALGILSLQALGQVPASDRTLVTDPNQLERMGFPRDATNVYIGNKPPAAGAMAVEPTSPNDFGGGYHFTPVIPKAIVGREDIGGSWQYNGGDEGCCTNLSRKGTEKFGDAAVELGTGLNIAAIRWWMNNSNGTYDMAFYVFETCHPGFSGGPTVSTIIAHADPAGTPTGGNQSNIMGFDVYPYTVDNENCRLTVRTRFDGTSNQTFQKVRFQWNRQVSPDPAYATFGDVPVGSTYHRFVEALYASGITAGCGGGNFCPNTAVTRGQMAVFLAAALGLNWQ